jgi:ABC-type multidrug transport system ATPase subunit
MLASYPEWGRKPGNRVIDDLDLTLEPGTLTWIGCSNGVGKTTLLRVLAGLIGPTDPGERWLGEPALAGRRADDAGRGRLALLARYSNLSPPYPSHHQNIEPHLVCQPL